MRPRQPSAPIDEAAEWLATLSDPGCTPEERVAFAQWLKRSNVNVEEFLTISSLTRRLETSVEWPQFDLEQLLAQTKRDEDTLAYVPARAVRGNERKATSRWPLAAAAAVVFLSTFLILGSVDWFAGSRYATRLGELRSVTLADGSIVQLDAQSVIRAQYTGGERAVELVRGTAIFAVAKDPGRPFRVSAGFAEIVAVGTSFNVSARRERTTVTVIEGRVRVQETAQVRGAPKGAPLELNAGEQAVAEPNKRLTRIGKVDPVKITAWTARRLYFENTPLAEAVQEFSRYSARSIRIEDAGLAQRRITGTFDAADPAALATFLRRYTDTAIEDTSEGWTVRPVR